MRLTFLGTGTSSGVPQIGCRCDVCTSTDPRDKRMRSGALVDVGSTRILIDAPPELRLQLIAAGVSDLDALLITHDHADHTHGLDDIRGVTARSGKALPVYGPSEALSQIAAKFPYIFDQSIRPLQGTTKPEGHAIPVEPGQEIRIGEAIVEPIEVPHGPRMRVFGYRIGALGYVTDAKVIPPEALARLRGVTVLVLNALRHAPHPTHLSVADAIAVSQDIGAKRTLLTHFAHDIGHAALAAELPAGVEPAYDGLTVEVN